jgi:amino acid transporter
VNLSSLPDRSECPGGVSKDIANPKPGLPRAHPKFVEGSSAQKLRIKVSTTKNNTLSLWSAVIINANIIIGSGVFINTAELAKRAGLLGGLSYAIVGLILLPLILSFMKLLELYPSGGFYAFCSASIHPLAGFINTWCYFFAKLSSAALSIHIFTLLTQKTFPVLTCINPLYFDVIILALLLGLNMLNVRTGSKIQSWIMLFKLFPLFFVIGSGIFLLNSNNITPVNALWSGIPSAIPLVLYALLGFEIACAISRNLENPKVDGPRAIIISYSAVIVLFVLYQTFFYGILGTDLATQADYRGTFPLLISKFGMSTHMGTVLAHTIHLAIATSALSAAFGIIYANMWNLYSLAELGHTVVPRIVMKHNRFNIPFVCVLAQGAIMLFYLFVIYGETTTFQQLSAFGATVTYAISILGLLATLYKNNRSLLIPVLGLANCALLLSMSLYAMWITNNPIPLQLFVGIMACGILMYAVSKKS